MTGGLEGHHGETRATSPSIKRRLLCLLYEGVLLFGVVMLAGLLYGLVTQQKHALVGSTGLQVFLFAVLGFYFVYFWRHSGQTLAMLTWRIKLVGPGAAPVSAGRALARYVLSWLWFLPALAAAHLSGLKGAGSTAAAISAGVLAYAALAALRSDRQFWHDVVCQTRLISCPAPLKEAKE